jgi:hypothetical protein
MLQHFACGSISPKYADSRLQALDIVAHPFPKGVKKFLFFGCSAPLNRHSE